MRVKFEDELLSAERRTPRPTPVARGWSQVSAKRLASLRMNLFSVNDQAVRFPIETPGQSHGLHARVEPQFVGGSR